MKTPPPFPRKIQWRPILETAAIALGALVLFWLALILTFIAF